MHTLTSTGESKQFQELDIFEMFYKTPEERREFTRSDKVYIKINEDEAALLGTPDMRWKVKPYLDVTLVCLTEK